MFIPMLLASSMLVVPMLVVPVKDTVWWNTTGGKVIEHRDDAGAACSLMLYNDFGSVVFQWSVTGETMVDAIDWAWQFPDNSKLPVAMQWGDVWLSNGGGSAIIQGVGHGNMVRFALKQRLDDLLRPADHLAVITKITPLSIRLSNPKISVLLDRFRLCRDAIRKITG